MSANFDPKQFSTVNTNLILSATRKLVDMNMGTADPDDRDSMANQTFFGPEDSFKERIDRDSGGIGKRILWKSTNAGKLVGVNSGSLTPQLKGVLLNSGLGQNLEEINPIEIYDQLMKTTRMGEGGIPSHESIPEEARGVSPSQFGFIDPYRSPESASVGVDNRLTYGVKKGDDGNLYTAFINTKTGKSEDISARQASNSIIAFPGEMQKPHNQIRAMIRGQLGYIDKSEVEFELPSVSNMLNMNVNLVPMSSAIQGNRLLMSKNMNQALALRDAEAPLVQSASGDLVFPKIMGKHLGAVFSKGNGQVTRVGKDYVEVQYEDGTKDKHELYNNFPLNRKSFIHNTALVKSGDIVTEGSILAKSNFTDSEGTLAMGKNLRTAFLPYKGYTYEDAYVISESAAKKMSSEHMYTPEIEPEEGLEVSRNKYISMFPGKFSKEQLERIDERGVIKPGMQVHTGDPLILATGRSTERAEGQWKHLSGKSDRPNQDRSMLWEHAFSGEVTDVYHSDKGTKVAVRAYVPMEEGDKLSAVYGDKGVIAKVIPDEEMPRDTNGLPFEVLQNPLTYPTRQNSSQIYELLLSKVARKTGQPVQIPQAMEGSYSEYVENLLREHGISDTESVEDPVKNRHMTNILTGEKYFMKFHHTAEGKWGAREVDGYASDDTPARGGAEGAKTVANLGLNALLSHSATDFIRDTKLYRGQRNDDFWRAFRLGYTPPPPKTPLVYHKFLAHLKGSGVNVIPTADGLNITAMTDADVDKIAQGEIKTHETLRAKDSQPIAGGLFDRAITGGIGGHNWSKIELHEPIPNPVMEEPIRRLLGIRQKDVEEILSGKKELFGRTGGAAIKEALSRIKVDEALAKAEEEIKTSRGANRDDAIKRLRYLTMSKEHKIHPKDFMITKLPVIPPNYRPISDTKSDLQLVSDANYLYQDLLFQNEALKEVKKEMGEGYAGDERVNLYRAAKAVSGLGDPVHPKLQEKKIGGLLTQVFGKGSPKLGMYQRKVIGSTVDMSGRGVITPNPKLNMDEVGMPEDQAWKSFAPFVIRRLTRRGMTATEAAKAIKEKRPEALRELVAEMEARPIVITRAPTLSRYGMMAAWPKLIKGHTLQVSPLVTSGFTADFDGNCTDFNTEIFLTISKLMVNYSIEGRKWFSTFLENKENTMFSFDNEVEVNAVIKIGNFPKIGNPVKDKNGADVYEVPKGVFITSYDHETQTVKKLPITKFTEEFNCPCVTVKTSRKKEVIVSDNESLAVFDFNTGELVKAAPKDSIGKPVPVVRKEEITGDKYNKDIGWWYGVLVSDGWVTTDGRTVGYSKLSKECRDKFIEVAREHIHNNFVSYEYAQDQNDNKYSNSVKVHLNGRELVNKVFSTYGAEEKSALTKRLPSELLQEGSAACLAGLFTGLIDGDSTFGWNTTNKNKRFVIKFNTSSPYLVKTIPILLRKLGIRCSITTTPARGTSKESYVICPSIVDFHRFIITNNVTLTTPELQSILEEFKDYGCREDSIDLIAVEKEFSETAANIMLREGRKNEYAYCRKAVTTGTMVRTTLQKILDLTDAEQVPFWNAVKARADNLSIVWEIVKEVEDAGIRSVYDFEIPDTKVFMLNNGLIVYDTMSYHVPISSDAVKDAAEKMMPSKNLKHIKDFKVHYGPSQEFLYGLYTAAQDKSKAPVKTFETTKDALLAYERGELGIKDEVKILKP